ncbi:MAG: hypothetical protein RLZZ306_2286 [Bacteroidota bacterium]|jgi:hypothetical protein
MNIQNCENSEEPMLHFGVRAVKEAMGSPFLYSNIHPPFV